uniref:Endonuclease/exonuclease/phosphatase domain-containing protein n=1 Tax=Octopus bimaculoides TaxID=37653 RepID=A0A0L8I0S1_OCTBM
MAVNGRSGQKNCHESSGISTLMRKDADDLPHYIVEIVIMISSLSLPDITLEGETRGPEDVSNATAEEIYSSPSTSSQPGDDGRGLNPSIGHLPPDGPSSKKRGIHLRKEWIIATWNVRGLITGKLNVITSEMKRGGVYAPTSEASEGEMQDFYDVVQHTLDNVPRTNAIILMGDWNAKVGKSITDSSSLGQHGLGEKNERGQDLVDLCITNNLVIGNTIFQHHPRRLYTWTSPGDRFRNQIDYIMIQGRWRSALKNVRTRPGADCGTDHQLLCATIKIQMRSRRKQTRITRYDVTKISEAFSVEMQNRFLPLLQSYDNGEWRSDALWEKMVNITKEVAERNILKR